jgi:hypothetical protein
MTMEPPCPWSGFPRAKDVGCESDLCAWIVHPAETWSNLAYFAVAAVLIARYGSADRHLRVAWLPWIFVVIGIGSAGFHASMVSWVQTADLTAIFVLTGFVLAAYLERAGLVRPSRFAWSVFALVAVGIALAGTNAWVGYVGIAAQGAIILWLAWRLPTRGPRRELLGFIALNQAAAIALWLDKGQVACVGGVLSHIVQPHSFWHILSAFSLLFLYRYERGIERALRGEVRRTSARLPGTQHRTICRTVQEPKGAP